MEEIKNTPDQASTQKKDILLESSSSPPPGVEKMAGNSIGATMVVGGGIAGIQAALDLANSGFKVYLVEETMAVGGRMSQLDKTFPTNDCSMCIISPKLVEVGKHPNIQILTNTSVRGISGEIGRFTVDILQKPRFIDLEKCTGCGECTKNCPVEVSNEFNLGLEQRKAIFKKYPQAIPNAFAISKNGLAPCRKGCPAGINVQGYVALISQGKFKESYELIRKTIPFPSVCGRVCNHPCEAQCNRKNIDSPVSIRALKRFVADWVLEHSETIRENEAKSNDMVTQGRSPEKISTEGLSDKASAVDTSSTFPSLESERKVVERDFSPVKASDQEKGVQKSKIAIVGAGPAGLTAAHDLALLGYSVTVYEALPEPGGMLRYGIPEYRLPRDVLKAEIDHILSLGIELRLNTDIGGALTVDSLKKQGYEAIFLSIGAHNSLNMGIQGENLPGVLKGLEFLKGVAEGKYAAVGRKVAVIGGGNVAIDSVQTAYRLGAKEAFILYRRSIGEMPADVEEIKDATDLGIKIHNFVSPIRVLAENGGIKGLECLKMKPGDLDASGRRRPIPIEGSEFFVECDNVILAIGQEPKVDFLSSYSDVKVSRNGTLVVDMETMATSAEGMFAGGDCALGPATAIEAIATGKKAAIAIDRYLSGETLKDSETEKKEQALKLAELPQGEHPLKDRQFTTKIPVDLRGDSFQEVDLGLTEEQAREEAARCLNCGICCECLQCVLSCDAKAINHAQQEKHMEVAVGSVVLAPGFELFEPANLLEYGYGRYPNVISSLEFERMLSPSGPFQGHVVRPSDHKEPKKVAWIQCAGSRDERHGRGFCSSVCCMYAIKEAIIAKEHQAGIETTIFFLDFRAFGKGFDAYYERAKKDYGVRYIRSFISRVIGMPFSETLLLSFVEDGKLKEEEFDLVVLSVGLAPSKEAREWERLLGVKTNEFGFCATSYLEPLETSRPGIFVCGVYQEPKDIPETVAQASGAAALAGEAIASGRNTLVEKRELPPLRDVSGEEPKIGVFVCRCGINIASVVDVPGVVEWAKSVPGVRHAEENMYTCSQDTQKKMVEIIEKEGLNRIVVASCSPRTHEPLFQETIRDAGLNKYLFDMANIRDQCSWVHMGENEAATRKAKNLVLQAISRARYLESLPEQFRPINRTTLVVGGGLAGMSAALRLANQGFPVVLLERERVLGGTLRDLQFTLGGDYVPAILERMIKRVTGNPLIRVFTNALIVDSSGYAGNFQTEILMGPSLIEQKLTHGAIIVATGAEEFKPTEYLYGQDDRVMTQLELERRLISQADQVLQRKVTVMIQCVGSRNAEHPYCSRVCCPEAIKNALKLKTENPEMTVYILYRDIRTYGFLERYYAEARRQGIIFLRYNPESKPELINNNDPLTLSFYEPLLGEKLVLHPDQVILSCAVVPRENKELASMLKIPQTAEGFFLEAHMKLRPVDFATDGIYLCGMAHFPKLMGESITQAAAAVARACTILSKDELEVGAIVSRVDPDKCATCLTCVRVCPYHVPVINAEGVAEIEAAKCHGCGICASECPGKAIELQHYKDSQLISKLAVALA